MEFVREFIHTYWHYFDELWLTLAIGFLISGIFYKYIPTSVVERHLGKQGLKPIFVSSIVGTMLPVCCIGSLPIAVTLRRKGATLGAVLAFLVATPATSISALIVSWKLMGFVFTAYLFVAVVIMALVMGIVVNRVRLETNYSESQPEESACCKHEIESKQASDGTFIERLKEILRYAFITLPKEMGIEILIGIALASFITVCEPLQQLIREHLSGMAGYIFILAMGVITYVCSTASVPMADAFVHSGLSYGQALCYLLVGPITSYGTILVIKKDFGQKILTIYLFIICSTSLIYGLIYDLLMH